MKPIAATAFAVATLLVGCRKSPYDYMENWVIREEAARPFSISADVIYLQDRLYVDMHAVPSMVTYARSEVGGERFRGVARIFSPLVASYDDLEMALDWYFSKHHDDRRPFAFIGEGEGGALLKAYEEENYDKLKKKGLALSFYSEKTANGFVTDDMVYKLKNAVTKMRYESQWDRDMPEGMLRDVPPASSQNKPEDTIKR